MKNTLFAGGTLGVILFLNCLLVAQKATADDTATELNYWRCIAHDDENKEWIAKSSFELAAINKAYDACKKQSNIPSSCKTAKETCEVFMNGVSTRPMWRCTAFDQMAKSWPSNTYTHRDDAAIAAKAYCEQGSAFPDTCFINLMTCKNMNSKE
jgi:hypothetical protein